MTASPIGRRRFLAVAGALAATATGCAGPGTVRGGGNPSGNAGPELKPVGPGKVSGSLSFAHWRAEDKTAFDTLIARFRARHPGTSITQDIAPSNDYQTTALQRIRSGDVGDVFTSFPGAQFTQLRDAGVFTDLSPQLFTDNYRPHFIRAGKNAAGDQLGLPYQLVFNMPVYNADAFDKAGISERPPDWDSFLDACDKLKSRGLTPIAWPAGEAGNAGHFFNCMVMNNAPTDDMCTGLEQGRYACTDDWFLRTLRQYRQLRPFFQPNATGTQVEPCQQLFANGKAGMLATGSFHITAVRELGARFPMELLSPITVPRDQARHIGVSNATFYLAVNAASDSQEAAAKFIEFLSSPEVATKYANDTVQHLTIAEAEYHNPDLKATEHWLYEDTALAPRYQFLKLDLRDAVENACIEAAAGKPPEQAAEEAQQIVDQIRGR